jgi:hypothetical protein
VGGSSLYILGYNKNSEIYRKFFWDLYYSISGYWEIFYWKVNNEIADEYKPSLLKKIIYKFRDIYKKRKK